MSNSVEGGSLGLEAFGSTGKSGELFLQSVEAQGDVNPDWLGTRDVKLQLADTGASKQEVKGAT